MSKRFTTRSAETMKLLKRTLTYIIPFSLCPEIHPGRLLQYHSCHQYAKSSEML